MKNLLLFWGNGATIYYVSSLEYNITLVMLHKRPDGAVVKNQVFTHKAFGYSSLKKHFKGGKTK
jgi:hypothetical protein